MPRQRRPEARARRLWTIAGAAALGLAALLWAGRDELPDHVAHRSGAGRAQVVPDYAALSDRLDPAALARTLGAPGELPLRCAQTADGRVCTAPLLRADGQSAERLTATWQGTRLVRTDVRLPWWAHHGMVRALTARLGAPTRPDAEAPDDAQAPAIAWQLDHGTLRIARAPGWAPWRWTTLRWQAAEAPL
ncbi:MAG TPA: hypothetical protein VMS38_26845 [Pseudorhodoferax sp.]|jgi:hypothetical protein|nr:hypothetical protein [Pseudorhodoferax sp.]